MTRKYESKLFKLLNMNWWKVLIIGTLTTWLIFVNGYVNMRTGRYAIVPLFWINALLAIYTGISISKIICKVNCVERKLSYVGKNSIIYVCLNQIVVMIVNKLVRTLMATNIASLLILFLSMLVLYGLSVLFTKTKLKVFAGR